MESWTEENQKINLLNVAPEVQNECYKQRTDLLSTDWLRAAQRDRRRRGCPKRHNSTQLNSTGRRRGVQSDSTDNSAQLDVEWS